MSRSASPLDERRSRSRSPLNRSPRYDRDPSPRRSRSPPQEKISLYVSGLAARVVDEDLLDHFRASGGVKDARVVLDPRTRDSRGFGFVDYENHQAADNAVRELDRSVLKGRVISIEKAKRARPRTPTPGTYRGIRSQRDLPPSRYDRGGGRYDRGYPRSPSPPYYRRRRSPPPYRRRSPSPPPYRRRSPSPYRRRSPSPYRRRSPSPYRRRSLSPY